MKIEIICKNDEFLTALFENDNPQPGDKIKLENETTITYNNKAVQQGPDSQFLIELTISTIAGIGGGVISNFIYDLLKERKIYEKLKKLKAKIFINDKKIEIK